MAIFRANIYLLWAGASCCCLLTVAALWKKEKKMAGKPSIQYLYFNLFLNISRGIATKYSFPGQGKYQMEPTHPWNSIGFLTFARRLKAKISSSEETKNARGDILRPTRQRAEEISGFLSTIVFLWLIFLPMVKDDAYHKLLLVLLSSLLSLLFNRHYYYHYHLCHHYYHNHLCHYYQLV